MFYITNCKKKRVDGKTDWQRDLAWGDHMSIDTRPTLKTWMATDMTVVIVANTLTGMF